MRFRGGIRKKGGIYPPKSNEFIYSLKINIFHSMAKFHYDVDKYDKRFMIGIPAAFMVAALIFVIISFASCGLPVSPGIDFAGGTAVTIQTDQSEQQVIEYFAKYDLKSVDSGMNGGYYLKFSPMDDTAMKEFNAYTLKGYPNANIEQFGATFGKTLQNQALIAIIIAFIGMALVVFIAFRKIIPAITVVAAGVADTAITAAVMNIIGMELSLATTAALLMLIGYSVDSNILMTTKVLKRQGDDNEKFAGAFRTGFIMTSTTFSAMLAMFIVSLIGQVQTLYQISGVLVIGLICDFFFTWAFNAGILKLYLDKKNPKNKVVQKKKDVVEETTTEPEVVEEQVSARDKKFQAKNQLNKKKGRGGRR